jgi:hypothetical protein
MNCVEVQKGLDRLIAHRDSSQFSPQMMEHLKECAVCRAKMQAAKETVQLLTHMPQVPPHPEFSVAWQKKIRQVAGAKFKWKSYFAFLNYPSIRPVMGAVLLVSVSLTVYRFFYSAVRTNYPLAKAVSLHKPQRQGPAVEGKLVRTAKVNASYQLKIIAMGSKVGQVRQLIRNYRSVGSGALMLGRQLKTASVLNGLKRSEAQKLQKKLERVGAIVEIAPE